MAPPPLNVFALPTICVKREICEWQISPFYWNFVWKTCQFQRNFKGNCLNWVKMAWTRIHDIDLKWNVIPWKIIKRKNSSFFCSLGFSCKYNNSLQFLMVENFCWYCSSAKAIAARPKYICNVRFHISLAKKSAQQKIKVINWTVLQPLQSVCAWWDLEKCIRFFLRAILLWCSFGLLTKQEGHASGPKRAIIMYWKKKREMEAFHTICKQFFKRLH